ncbi:MAG TPA: YCF48-related protein, partial [Bacteroidales bacterium]|nr:YCF48-related protein [Bacteroidales bacterium]
MNKSLFLTIFLIFCLGGIALKAQQWQWLNPKPTGSYLRDICFTGPATGYIVGDYGTILKTLDGGLTWHLKESGTQAHLNSVFFINQTKGFAVSYGTILKTTNSGETWTIQSGFPVDLVSIFFANENTGYAAGGNAILKTTDGGNSWNMNLYEDYEYFHSLFFTSSDTGFVLASYPPLYERYILKTTNGGTSWGVVAITDNYPEALWFTDASTGYMADNYGGIFNTTDGGLSWTLQFRAPGDDLHDIFFQDSNHGFAVGIGPKVIMTTDAGATWFSAPNNTGAQGLRSVWFTDPGHGVILGGHYNPKPVRSSILHTEDGGITFTDRASGFLADDCFAMDFPTPGIGYIAGDSGFVMKTTDGGNSWTFCQTSSQQVLYGISFPSMDNGYVVGKLGTILHTTDGGMTWTPQSWGGNRTLHDVDFYDEMNGLCAGDYGRILKTSNG